MNYIVNDFTKFICIKNPEKEGTICKEMQLCETINEEDGKKLSDSDCNNYPVSKENKNTHICIKDQNLKKCIEQILCESVKNSLDKKEIICSNYPVKIENTGTHICVKNTNGNTPCIEEKLIPKTSIIKGTLLETESLNIASTTENITFLNKTIKTTTPFTNENDKISIILLGCSQFKMKNSFFSFNIHFAPTPIYSKFLGFPVSVIYDNYLGEEDYYANCTLNEDNSQSMLNYFCKVQVETAKIKQIKLQPVFNFASQKKVTLKGISPIAKRYMDNLKDIDERINNLFLSNPNIYILNNSTIFGNNYQFNLSGIISGSKLEKNVLINKNLLLLVNIESDQNEKKKEIMVNIESEQDEKTKEINCTIIDIINNNCTLSCLTTDINKYDLQSSISIFDEGMLMINFDCINKENCSIFSPQKEKNETNERQIQNEIYLHRKKSKKFGTGPIIAIVLACIVALAIIIGLIIYFRKKNVNKIKDSSTVTKFNI